MLIKGKKLNILKIKILVLPKFIYIVASVKIVMRVSKQF